MRNRTRKPLFIIIRGLPGAGKSALAEALLRLPMQSSTLRLDPDRVDRESRDFQRFISSQETEIPLKTKIYRYLLQQAEDSLGEGRDVIWEQPWRVVWGIKVTIEKLVHLLDGQADTSRIPFQVVIVEVSIDLKEARRRVVDRFSQGKHRLDEEAFEEFVRSFESCNHLGVPIIRVDGNQPSAEVARTVQTFIKDLVKKGENL